MHHPLHYFMSRSQGLIQYRSLLRLIRPLDKTGQIAIRKEIRNAFALRQGSDASDKHGAQIALQRGRETIAQLKTMSKTASVEIAQPATSMEWPWSK